MIPVTIGSRASQRAAFDLLQTNRSPSSSWRETAETRERARDAENELALQREAVRSLRTQLHVAEQQRRDDVRALEKQMAVLKTRVAEEAARADDRVETVVSSESKKHAELSERHSRLRREHAALQAAVGRAGGGARGASDTETALTSERDDRFREQLELVERNTRAEGRRAYEALERAKETQLAQTREQSAAFLADARAELASKTAQFEKEIKNAESTAKRLTDENAQLRSWASSMNGVLRKIEEGAYPIVERGFWRSLRVPPAETTFARTIPGAASTATAAGGSTLPTEARTDAISRAATNASRFLRTMEDRAMATAGTAEFRAAETSERGERVGERVAGTEDLSRDVSSAVPVAFGVSTTRPVDPYDTATYDTASLNNTVGETFEMRAFRRRGDLAEEERSAVQEATLKELASHPTVEYIRALEEENAKMKADVSASRRSASDARVALQSARRQQEQLAQSQLFATKPASGRANRKPRAASARSGGARRMTEFDAFGATVPKETFVGPPMSPESFRATLNEQNGGGSNLVTHTATGLTASMKSKPAALTSPEVADRVRVTTMSRDAARRASARRARAGVDRNADGASVGYLANQSRERRNFGNETNGKTGGSSSGPTSPRPPFGTGGGRRLTDAVPLAGRPLSGSAEVGHGFVLGDGPDAHGGAVGWPAGADRAKSLAERPDTGPGGVRSGGAKRT